MNVQVVRAAVFDLSGLLPLVTAYRVFYGRSPDPQRERDFIESQLCSGTSTIFLARDADGNTLGFVQIFHTYSTVWLGPALILEDIFVVPEARRGGIATKLLQRAGAHAREIGAIGMFLETAMDNLQAQRLYEQAGWKRESQFYKYNATL